MADTVLVHPNRDKASSQTLRAIVFLLLVVSAALILIVTLGGWSHLQGAQPISFAYVIVYVVMAWQVARWNRGVLPCGRRAGHPVRGDRGGRGTRRGSTATRPASTTRRSTPRSSAC